MRQCARLARKGGPLWGAVGRELESLLLTPGNRAMWLGRYECDDVGFWVARLLEQDLEVRVVAIRRLAHWKHLPRVREALLWQLLDRSHGVMPGTHGEPALAAAAVLREAPRTEELLGTLRAHLEGDDEHLAGGCCCGAPSWGSGRQQGAEHAQVALPEVVQSPHGACRH